MVYLRVVIKNKTPLLIMSEDIIPDVEMTSDVPEKKSLAELVGQFEELVGNEDRMKMSKEADMIKAAFYKTLARERSENEEDASFDEIENAFKEMYNAYKKERSDYNRKLEQEAVENLALKEAVIADLKEKLAATTKELASLKSVTGRLRTADLEEENSRLKEKLRSYEDTIERNNLWSLFGKRRRRAEKKGQAI